MSIKNSEITKIAFITAIYGNYEQTCKQFAKQSIPCDFICFTDNKNIIKKSDWIIDTTPYHILNPSSCDQPKYINSLKNNKHTFNIAKYYKQAFINIPILKKYECIIWLDGTISVYNPNTAEYIMKHIQEQKIIGWGHERMNGNLLEEVRISIHPNVKRYSSTFWYGQKQPFQDLANQYKTYLNNGYRENYWENLRLLNPLIGVWCTCFVAFLQHDKQINDFLQHWYKQTLEFTTQDQVGFSYSLQKCNLCPLTLPNNEINGYACSKTDFFTKEKHENTETQNDY
tara:strand:+ start:83 stop:937 length:855 start_codon:yes stop_codon:yes gene_type:complete